MFATSFRCVTSAQARLDLNPGRKSNDSQATISEDEPIGGHAARQSPSSGVFRPLLDAVLDFLAERPVTLLEGLPTSATTPYESLHQQVMAIVPLLADKDESIRSRTSRIVHELTTEDFIVSYFEDLDVMSYDFYMLYGRLTWVGLSCSAVSMG